MKKALLLASLTLVAGTAHAQTPLTKGRGLVSGTIGYHREGDGGWRGPDLFEFSPTVGIFVVDNLAIGVNASIHLYGSSSNSYAVGPFTRYYRFVGGDKFALFGQGS